MILPLPQPQGADAMALVSAVDGFVQLVLTIVGMFTAGVLLIWWKVRDLNLLRPGQAFAEPIHRLEPESYRDDTGIDR